MDTACDQGMATAFTGGWGPIDFVELSKTGRESSPRVIGWEANGSATPADAATPATEGAGPAGARFPTGPGATDPAVEWDPGTP